MGITLEQKAWAGMRIGLGWIMFWAFIDKMFGLGFATAPNKSWLAGGSPTTGFLQHGVSGPMASLFSGLAGNAFIDFIFMAGLLLIGVAMISGIGIRIGGYAGALFMFLLWLSVLLPANNPILDEHIIYMIAFIGIASASAGQWYGLGKWWANTGMVKRYRILE